MRSAALAFGVLAGFVASLILALGGLDAGVALQGSGDRQVSLLRFGLFVIANFGVFGAGLVLAAPLAGAILLMLGAVGWVGAALLLRHGPDLVLSTPPALLVIAAIIAVVARLRTPRATALPDDDQDVIEAEPDAAPRREAPEPSDFDSMPAVPVTAGFFNAGGAPRAEPSRPPDPGLRGLDQRDQIRGPLADNWDPRKKKKPPPRQEPMFRPPEGADDEDDGEEEPFFARFGRGATSLLSFGLYAALAGAALLVFWNLRTGEAGHPAVGKAELAVSSSAAPSSEPVLAPVLSSSAEPAVPSAPPSSSEPAAEAQTIADLPSGAQLAPALLDGVIVAPDPFASSEAPERLQEQAGLALADAASSEPPSSTEPAEFPSDPAPAATGAPPQPFTMTPQMAAARARPRPQFLPEQETTTGL
ncbi:MAG: hypothetical protein HY834_01245 [Devosia nanyangense]|uniref:Uncharacterized protein n=1 Tax=Devosia nanyangense TaxID=1228055 RepID=A0A933KXB8_9HYPH|nr:hypothetical protein [Devosia nanyangense]